VRESFPKRSPLSICQQTLFWRGKAAIATVQKDNPQYKGAITGGDQKRIVGNEE
jgi:hypothetical protein